MNYIFNELRQQRVKYDVHTTRKIKFILTIFTALHVMQTRYCDEISVRPSVRLSVCLSHAWIVTKR